MNHELRIKNNILKRFLAILVALFLTLNPMIFPVAVYAEETSGGGQESTQSTPTPTPTPEISTTDSEVTPTPTPESTITTGDASSSSEVDTTANTNQDTIPGEITTPPGDCQPPEGETSCLAPTEITNNNVADIGDSATSSASTGENSISGTSGDALIVTGEATASGSIENEVNTNIVELEPDQEEGGEAGAEVSEDPALTVDNQNQATVSADGNISASTGENQASENAGNAEIETGDALAYGNIFNLLNTNIVGTNFVILVLNLVDQNGDIDLNKVWMEILGQEQGALSPVPENSEDLTIAIRNQSEADLENNINVTASSGQNQASDNGGVAKIKTGNATALANVVNLVNTNLLGSVFFFGVVNIFNSFSGNLILPRPERFVTNLPPQEEGQADATSLENDGESSFVNQNEAEVEGEVSSQASSGENELLGNTTGSNLTTGDAKSAAQSFTIANLNVQRNNWFSLTINNVGSWLGSVLGWSSPQASETADSESNIYDLGLEEDGQNSQGGGSVQESTEGSGLPLTMVNQNKAKVKDNILVSAQTGQNEASGNNYASVETGRATALANRFNLVNLNILGGRWFMGVANILGDWQGNAVFAYPDVQISVSDGQEAVEPGDFLEYTVTFQNQGYDEAQGVNIQLNLPAGVSYISDTSGVTPQTSGGSYTWMVGNVPQGIGGSFKVRVEVGENYSGAEEISFWSKLIPKAYAAEEEFKGDLVVNVSIVTSDPESDTANNSASDVNKVYAPVSTSPSSEGNFVDNPGEPKLEITAWNNVGEFVYPGDTVTFELTVKNSGSGPADESVLTQTMFDGGPQSLGDVQLNLGKIEPGKKVKITFGLTLMEDLPPALYHTVAKVTGKTPKGQEITSDSAETQFEVRSEGLASQVLAAEASEGEAKAQETSLAPTCQAAKPERDWLPYILLGLLTAFWFTDWLKGKGKNGELATAFATLKKKLRK